MRTAAFAASILIVSSITGALLAADIDAVELPEIDFDSFQLLEDEQSLEYGSAHEHALFYVAVNGSELNFSQERFQLNSRYVHLENKNSRIVHKHAEGVEWSYFLETLNVSLERNGATCLDLPSRRYCGNATVMLDGETDPDLDSEIKQDQKLAIVLGNQSLKNAREYMEEEMPPEYRPRKSGRSL